MTPSRNALRLLIGIQAGGIFVDKTASDFFIKRLYDGGLDPDQVKEYLETATQKFITEVKPSFENPTEKQLIAVADRTVSSAEANIERGYMTLTGWAYLPDSF